MKYKTLGNTNISISEFALGCWPFAGGHIWGKQEDKDSISAVEESINQGINFFDTAPGYGNGRSERILGIALKNKRHKNIIATKSPPSSLEPWDIRIACEQSLTNLQTEYIDLYQIHWPNHDINIEDSINELTKLLEEGKIRSIGVSNFGVKDFTDISKLTYVVSNQVPYNGLWRAIEFEIQEICMQYTSGIICYSPLAQGLLTGRYNSPEEVPPGISRSRLFSKDRSPQSEHNEEGCEELLFSTIKKLKNIASENNIPLAILSLGWLKTRKGILSLLVGSRNASEVLMNIPSFNYEPEQNLQHTLTQQKLSKIKLEHTLICG